MDLSFMHRTVVESNDCEPFQLAPVSGTEAFFKVYQVANFFAARDRLNLIDSIDDLERFPDVHAT